MKLKAAFLRRAPRESQGKPAPRLFCVSIDAPGANLPQATEEMISAVRWLAAAEGHAATVRSGGETTDRQGVFYLSGTEGFARKVRGISGILAVKKPETRRPRAARCG